MTLSKVSATPSNEVEPLSWRVDTDRQLLFIDLASGFTDYDLTKHIPTIWKENPDIIWFNVVVDQHRNDETNNWSWNGLLTIAQEWQAYAQGRNSGKHVAIVTENYWITQLVNKALGPIFPGSTFKCFKDHAEATAWALTGPRPEMQ
ncbi:STAS/SEC14 domain-containing protein [Nisaea sp.]|uniref:STAS/SEC14 domain-containing protein n=1 Tax=Nisaea sp. TaxID=2024842 RepID=UPI003266F490